MIKMDSPNVIITKQNKKLTQYSLENEIGLSTYDLALISVNKIIKRKKLAMNELSQITYII
tara:strand:- start:612 stop:794 length:183 start_codon:yes stop_codon:yes gene_type:complete